MLLACSDVASVQHRRKGHYRPAKPLIRKASVVASPRAGTKQPFERAIFAMVASRALSPSSKLYCWDPWLREEVYLPSASVLELQHLCRAMGPPR